MKEQYLINYLIGNESVWVFPDLEEKLENIINNVIPENTKYLLTKDSIANFYFINAYTCDFSLPQGSYSVISFNIELAKPIFISMIRNARDPLFKNLDVQFMRELESGDSVKLAEITTKKQQLRDVTSIDLSTANDLDSLKLLWPTSILGDFNF